MHTDRFSAKDFKPVLDAAQEISAGSIKFRGRDFASREEALAAALGDLHMWVQINLLDKEDKEHGRTLSRSDLEKRLGSFAAGLRRLLKSLTDKDGKLLPEMRDALVEAPAAPGGDARAPSLGNLRVAQLLARKGDIAPYDAPELARRLDAADEDGRRFDDAIAGMRWLLERSERATVAGIVWPTPDHKLIDDICEIWTKILDRKVGAGGSVGGPFVRFAKACLDLVGWPLTPNAIRHLARRVSISSRS